MIYLLAVWLVIEATAQLARLGVTRSWGVGRLPGDRNVVCLHPLLILYDDAGSLPHERWHALQMARWSVVMWYVLYLLSGRWAVKFEAEADVRAYMEEHGDSPPGWWIKANARLLTDPTYFPRHPLLNGLPFHRDPGLAYAVRQQERYVRKAAPPLNDRLS